MSEKDPRKLVEAAIRRRRENEPWQWYRPYESRTRKGVRPQELFHGSSAKIRALICANQAGKTTSGCLESIWRAEGKHPYNSKWNTESNPGCIPNHGWIIVPDWRNHALSVTVPTMLKWLPKDRYDWNGHEGRWTNKKTGSTITVRSAESGRLKFQGAVLDWVWEDEEIPHGVHQEAMTRMVSRGLDMWITATPFLEYPWILDEVIEPWKNNQVDPRYLEVFQIGMFENPYIGEDEYKAFVETHKNDPFLKTRLHGEVTQLSGLVYPGFEPNGLHKWPLDEKVPPRGWKKFCAIDFGFTNPFVCLWFAIDGDGALYLFHEHYQDKWRHTQHAHHINEENERMGLDVSYYVADPEDATGIAELGHWGIKCRPADKKWHDGLNRVREFLAPSENGNPRFYVHPDCSNFIWEMGRYKFKDPKEDTNRNKPEKPDDQSDHGPDALRYACMSRPSPNAPDPRPKVTPYSGEWWSKQIPKHPDRTDFTRF